MTSFSGRTVIVTGGAQGIGAAIVTGFLAEGANVVVADLVPATGLQDTVAGGRAIEVHTDVADEASCEALAGAAEQTFGRIDVLVNNAAVFTGLPPRPFHEIPLEEWDRTMAVNVRGPWLCVKAVRPAMLRTGGGAIVNVTTNRVLTGVPNMLQYDASKGALEAMTRVLAVELGPENIRVNAIAPGLTMSDNVRAREGIEERNAAVVERRPIRRSQTPEDVVQAALFLASDASGFVTGHTLVVDGGSIIR